VAPHLTSHFITSVLLPPPPYILNSSVLESPNFLKKKIQIRKIVLQFAKLKMDGIYTYIYAGVCKDAYPRNYKYWCPSVVKGGFTIGNRDVLFFIYIVIPCYPWGTGSRTLDNMEIHGCSSPL
jgi:hypothetical protein